MLLDNKYREYDFPNISDDEAMTYSKWINGNYPDECRCKVKKIVAFLDNIFYQKEKNLRKINIPILFLMADKALSLSISGTNFRRWFVDFFDKHKDEYGQYCSSGSIKKEKTLGRIEVMERYFDDYFRTDIEEITEQKGSPENEDLKTAESAEQGEANTEESGQKSPDTEQAEASSDEAAAEQEGNVSNEPSDADETESSDGQNADSSDEQNNPDGSASESDGQEASDAEQSNDESGEDNSSDNQESSDENDESSDNTDDESDGSDDIDTENSSVSEDADSKISTPFSGARNMFKKTLQSFMLLS